MLWISKVTSGVATDGKSEFSMFVVDDKENVYEIQTDDGVYEQLIEVIGSSLSDDDRNRLDAGAEKAAWSEGNRGRLADLISAKAPQSGQAPQPPQHSVEGEEPPNGRVPLSSVGFDVDYSAEFDSPSGQTEEDEDPGEEGIVDEDQYVESL